jgi:two-component system, OmpR family, sensor histidine kinase KdpD
MAEKPVLDENTDRPTEVRVQGFSEQSRQRGKIKVFLSYAPGTGKTLTMLEDAYRQQKEGKDVVIGFVDAHRELVALQLLEKFEVLPQRIFTGTGISYHGMDLDAVLARKPQLVVVDHLAYPNPPGFRHEMRYREVDELLSAGIDVYTTLNIYQLESQVDAVSYLTGVVIRDTVPDHLLDEADQLQFVDVPPQELLLNFRSGRIYIPTRAENQMKKYFQPSSLFALRELALRYVAHRSNNIMRSLLIDEGITRAESTSTRLLVCVSESLNGSRLVRAARRMADETRSEWTVVYVETPDSIAQSEEAQAAVAQQMRLAELLGGQVETLTGRSVVETVREYALKNHIHRVMVGRSSRNRWKNFLGTSFAEQLMRGDPNLSVYVVGSDYTPRPVNVPRSRNWISRMQLLGSLGLVLVPTVLGMILTPTIISRSANVIMLYLLSVVIASIFLGLFPALLTAVLGVLIYDFIFVPPIYRLFGFAPENAITFLSLLIVSIIISTLVSRERALTQAAQRRAEQVTQLYELSRDLAAAVDMPDILNTIIQHVQRTFDRDLVILLPDKGELMLSASGTGDKLDTSELTAAEWAFQQGRSAGYNTGTFSYASFRYFPLETSRGIIGVMGVKLAGQGRELHPEQVRMLSAFVTKAASAIDRALLAEEASQAEILRATEKLQSALLNSISHDLRTPLASITGVLSSLRMEDDMLDPETRRELVETAYGEAERLNRLVGNLLDMSRLESGMLKTTLQPCDIQDVIGSALNLLSSRLEEHPIKVEVPPDLPLISMDYVLVQQVLINLLDNAAKYSGESEPIDIHARISGKMMQVEVEDRGPGIPEKDLERIFEKFYRVKRFENVVGTGLGLSICKGVVEVHGGRIWAENRPEGGVKLAFTLPIRASTLVVPEQNMEELQEEVQS